jgi:hypothetical protein
LNGVERNGTKRERVGWENELWTYLCSGDGVSCPLSDSCLLRRRKNVRCFTDETDRSKLKAFHAFVDNDEIKIPSGLNFRFNPVCIRKGRIFELVTKLARKYRAGVDAVPVPDNLISADSNNVPIEVRRVPLKAYRGAVWRMSDCWLIQLNDRDPYPRLRFTLYHEIFHVLAHSRCTPVFKRKKDTTINFNEMLADHFSANILLPPETLVPTWEKIGNIERMADIFEVPRPVMLIALRCQGLV